MENSPLGKLPPELRNEIHKLALTSAFQINLSIWYISHKSLLLSSDSDDFAEYEGAGLVKTCKQNYQEANMMVYALNTFKVHDVDTLKFFVKSIGHRNAGALQRESIRSFARVTVTETLQESLMHNKAARERLRTVHNYATKYDWKSVEVMATFRMPHEQMFVSLDLLHPNKPRRVYENWRSEPSIRNFSEYLTSSARLPALYASAVNMRDELDAWNDIMASFKEQATDDALNKFHRSEAA